MRFLLFTPVFAIPIIGFIQFIMGDKMPLPVKVLLFLLHILLASLIVYLFDRYEKKNDTAYREQLQLKENELKALYDNNKSYLWSIDLEKETFMSSSGFENIFGYSRELFLNNFELWLERVLPEDKHLAEEHYAILKSGKPSNMTWRFRDSIEQIKWLDAWGDAHLYGW